MGHCLFTAIFTVRKIGIVFSSFGVFKVFYKVCTIYFFNEFKVFSDWMRCKGRVDHSRAHSNALDMLMLSDSLSMGELSPRQRK